MMMKGVQQIVNTAAIGLIVSGTINCSVALLTILGGLLRLVAGLEQLPRDNAEKIGFFAGTGLGYGLALIMLIASPIVIYGATQMMAGKKYGLSKASAILTVLPLTSCCFAIGIPIGIWALVVLYKPEVRSFFANSSNQIASPPHPPKFGT